jgi:hypothetical protein
VKTGNLQRSPILPALILALGLFSVTASAQKLTIKIPPTKIPMNVKDQPISITAFGLVTMVKQERDLSVFDVELDGDLSDLQHNLTPLLSEQMDKDDRCGDRLTIQHATLVPAPPASLATVELHYERWGCAKVFGKEQTKKLIGGNAVVPIKLTPAIDKGNSQLRLDPVVGQVQADGSLGELLRSGSLGDMIREKISASIQSALQKGTNLSATLPPAIQGYVTIQNAQFKDAGSGRLLLVLNGEVRITKEQIQALTRQVKEHTATIR